MTSPPFPLELPQYIKEYLSSQLALYCPLALHFSHHYCTVSATFDWIIIIIKTSIEQENWTGNFYCGSALKFSAAIVMLGSHECAARASIFAVITPATWFSLALVVSMLSTTAMQYYCPAGPASAAGYPKAPYYAAINASMDQLPSPTFISTTPLHSPIPSLYTTR